MSREVFSKSRKGPVVAIDGPSGAGKSTIARLLAERLGFLYIDTGAMYRAVALAVKRAGISPDDEESLAVLCRGLEITFEQRNGGYRVIADGIDVSEDIRTPEISLLTSRVSAKKAVRDVLLQEQRRLGSSGNVVLEGRDIGSVVFPDAEVKFFLSASAEERGRRRYLELRARGEEVTLEQTVADVKARDARDEQRTHAPLRKAEDAVEIDSTGLSIEEVLALMERYVRAGERKRNGGPAVTWPMDQGSQEVCGLKIILAKQAGFCFGVERATQMAFEAANKGVKTFTLGPIIHSPQVVKRLEEMGVKVLESINDLDNGAIIIRSHGVAAKELQEANRKELEVVDATCPFVKKAQEHVKSLSQAGYDVVVVGDADHPEVQGIVSYALGKVYVAGSGEEAGRLAISGKIGIVAQTTQSFENLKNVVLECLAKGSEIRVFNTICDATAVRQEEAKELAKQVDCMIVIGGYNSANTTRLAQVCAEIQPKTYHIETARQLNDEWFDGVETVGVTAGASTPKWVIDEVLHQIRQIDRSKTPLGKSRGEQE